ncbi:molybdenum cofactor guanylyltransferase MobA [Emcibacter sp.]|uniref:molybdenum cofactor guanylyltransferase MobA n=1 Tax=Emcibacter sp. TaxID=1979954 RepID=UPI003A903045
MTDSTPYITGIILAGGRSRRMGDNKLTMPLGDKTVLKHVIDRAEPQVDGLLLSYNEAFGPLSAGDLPVIPDNFPDAGPLGGLEAGLARLEKTGGDYLLSFAGDVPFVPGNYAVRLFEAISQGNHTVAVASSANRLHGVMGLWHVSLLESLRDYLTSGERRVMTWLERQNRVKVVWEDNPDPFFNVNSPEDMDRARRLLD